MDKGNYARERILAAIPRVQFVTETSFLTNNEKSLHQEERMEPLETI